MNTQHFEPIAYHKPNWDSISTHLRDGLYPQSSLYLAAKHAQGPAFVARLAAALLCRGNEPPCGQCGECERLINHVHPDFIKVVAEGKGDAIKIDQIRALCDRVVQTPQRGKCLVVALYPADRLNTAAANALLKILEEPPKHAYFILLAEQSRTIPATVLSRCQIRALASPAIDDYLSLAAFYADSEERAKLLSQQDVFVEIICQYLEDEIPVTALTDTLSQYPLSDVLWFLSLIISFLLERRLLNQALDKAAWHRLSKTMHLPSAFKMLSQIYTLLEKLNHNININTLMALDHLFMLLKP